jgi:hypothetical protein
MSKMVLTFHTRLELHKALDGGNNGELLVSLFRAIDTITRNSSYKPATVCPA